MVSADQLLHLISTRSVHDLHVALLDAGQRSFNFGGAKL